MSSENSDNTHLTCLMRLKQSFELLRSSEVVRTNEGEEKSRATGAQLIHIIYTLHNQSR